MRFKLTGLSLFILNFILVGAVYARLEANQDKQGMQVIDKAQEIARQKYSECLNDGHINKQYPDQRERAKECFRYVSKLAKSEVTKYRQNNCQRESEQSEIMTCKDGSRYKLLDIDDLGGRVINISHSGLAAPSR